MIELPFLAEIKDGLLTITPKVKTTPVGGGEVMVAVADKVKLTPLGIFAIDAPAGIPTPLTEIPTDKEAVLAVVTRMLPPVVKHVSVRLTFFGSTSPWSNGIVKFVRCISFCICSPETTGLYGFVNE
jgi:hypothetical protein